MEESIMSSMFCYQCEQTAKCTGCTAFGVCGKDPETAAMQDLAVLAAKGVAQYAHRARELGASDAMVDRAVIEALFTSVTNVNFDEAAVEQVVRRTLAARDRARELYENAADEAGEPVERVLGPAQWTPATDTRGLLSQASEITIEKRQAEQGEDIVGLQELILYGLKGSAAYVDHARILGREDDGVYAFFHEALDYLAGDPEEVDVLLGMALRVGEVNLKVMGLLDAAHTETFGHPEPTPVRITPKAGKAILVSGHDLEDLKMLLDQTEGAGVNVYTHGEMLPAHGYPELKKYPHLVGNYGGAWQDQRREFDEFPGAILMTTNCIQKPQDSYKGRIFTTGLVGWPGVTHIDGNGNKDFGPVVDAARAADGFVEDGENKTILVGFGHNAVMNVAGQVVEAVKAGDIRHFFLIGGCDGAKSGRNYYTEFAEAVPEDCVILTLACGKYRFNKLEFGDISGIPRLLDIGQCNDAYSAIQIAVALANAFECDVNELPLSMILSWYEQKAVAILLTLLHLGIKNMRLGPSLPAFLTPAVVNVLVENYGIAPITTAAEDLKAILG
jgi:hydroxylamine reductase